MSAIFFKRNPYKKFQNGDAEHMFQGYRTPNFHSSKDRQAGFYFQLTPIVFT